MDMSLPEQLRSGIFTEYCANIQVDALIITRRSGVTMSKGRILVVEDNMDNYELVRYVLERAGYDVFLAVNGRDGVNAAVAQKPDFILMDLGLPEMDGWIAIEKLKADKETKNIPLYALTAHTLPNDRKRALEAGCDGYVVKPIQMKSFLDIIQEALLVSKIKSGQEDSS
jgi:two-component system cell cycle response regulator DivK